MLSLNVKSFIGIMEIEISPSRSVQKIVFLRFLPLIHVLQGMAL